MDKPVEIHSDGTVIVKIGFDNSVDARNFVAQIAHLVSYDGPGSKEIVFQIDSKSIRQAAEWGLELKHTLQRLREFSGGLPKNITIMLHRYCCADNSQEQGKYSRWIARPSHNQKFWTKLRIIQTFWLRHGFGLPINYKELPASVQMNIHKLPETWADLVRFAGLNPEEEAASIILVGHWTAGKVIADFQELKFQGNPLNGSWLVRHGHGSLNNAARNIFGSWEAAVRAAGFDPDEEWTGRQKRLTRKKVIEEIIKRKATGNRLVKSAVKLEYSVLVFSAEEHFGDWYSAVEASGLDSEEERGLSRRKHKNQKQKEE